MQSVSGVGGLVLFEMSALLDHGPPSTIVASALVGITPFGICYIMTVLRALGVLDARVYVPGVDPAAFRKVSLTSSLKKADVVAELVRSYLLAIEGNELLHDSRKPTEKSFRRWLRATTITGILAVVCVGGLNLAEIFSPQEPPRTGVNEMSSKDKPQDAPAEAQSSKTEAQPSRDAKERPTLEAKPRLVELGEKSPPPRSPSGQPKKP